MQKIKKIVPKEPVDIGNHQRFICSKCNSTGEHIAVYKGYPKAVYYLVCKQCNHSALFNRNEPHGGCHNGYWQDGEEYAWCNSCGKFRRGAFSQYND